MIRNTLKDYINNERLILLKGIEDPALFISLQHRRLSIRSLEKMIEKFGKKCGYDKKLTPHNHSQHEQEKKSCEKAPTIRQMPAYDPDAEVNSLCMTIDYWVTSIQRVNNKVKLNHITTDARIGVSTLS